MPPPRRLLPSVGDPWPALEEVHAGQGGADVLPTKPDSASIAGRIPRRNPTTSPLRVARRRVRRERWLPPGCAIPKIKQCRSGDEQCQRADGLLPPAGVDPALIRIVPRAPSAVDAWIPSLVHAPDANHDHPRGDNEVCEVLHRTHVRSIQESWAASRSINDESLSYLAAVVDADRWRALHRVLGTLGPRRRKAKNGDQIRTARGGVHSRTTKSRRRPLSLDVLWIRCSLDSCEFVDFASTLKTQQIEPVPMLVALLPVSFFFGGETAESVRGEEWAAPLVTRF